MFKKHGQDVWEKWDEHLNKLFDGERVRQDHLIHYTDEIIQPAQPDDEEADGRAPTIDKSVPFVLETDDEGWPLLPSAEDITLVRMKDIIRSYLTMIYREWGEPLDLPSCLIVPCREDCKERQGPCALGSNSKRS